MFFLLAGALILATLLLIGKCGLQLAENHVSDVRVICYLFSLTFALTTMISLWGIDTGAIDKNGNFQGEFGRSLKFILDSMLDLGNAIKILSAIFFAIVFPQLLSYFLSGLFGCASNFFLIRQSFSFYVWFLVKAFVSAAAILIPLGIIGFQYNWKNFDNNGLFILWIMALIFLMISFILLTTFREGEKISSSLSAYLPHWLLKVFAAIHNQATRNTKWRKT